MYFVYILQSEVSGRYYKGITSDLKRRLAEHNAGKERSTTPYKPWIMIWHTIKSSRAEAMKLEKKLKNITCRKKL